MIRIVSGNSAFPQNFYTRKLVEIMVFFAGDASLYSELELFSLLRAQLTFVFKSKQNFDKLFKYKYRRRRFDIFINAIYVAQEH